MVGRRLREHGLYARTVQVKLRNAAFQTVTRAKTLREPANLDQELREAACALFRENWKPGVRMRLLGVAASGLESEPPEQRSLLTESQKVRLREATAAADRMRDRFGDQMVGFAGSMQAGFREKTHESLPSVAKTSVKNE
jgi:DNA polymerase-4